MSNGIHVNTVHVNGIWISYDIESVSVKTVNKKGKKEECVCLVANFTKDGEKIHTIHNLGGASEIAKLLNSDYAKKSALEMIEQSNKSTHSPFLQ